MPSAAVGRYFTLNILLIITRLICSCWKVCYLPLLKDILSGTLTGSIIFVEKEIMVGIILYTELMRVRRRLTCLLLFIILIQKEIGHAHTLLIIRITVELGAKSAVSTTCLYMIIALTRYATFCLFFVKFAITMFSLRPKSGHFFERSI